MGYVQLCANPVWRQGLRVAVGQYVTANTPSPGEIAIMAAQSGLELLGWLRFVESGTVLPKDWADRRKWPAHKKIRDLLGLATVSTKVPTQLASLVGLDPSWRDGPDVVAGVRNRLVHPRVVGGTVGWPRPVLTDVWLLASSYLEMALLHATGVVSPVRDRLDPRRWTGSTTKPPWVP
jgi:hypothetical protein